MDKDELKRFLAVQDNILTNLASLKATLTTFLDEEVEDPDSALYNELLDLIESARTIENLDDFSEIQLRGQAIEKNLDFLLGSKGMTTINLSWPEI